MRGERASGVMTATRATADGSDKGTEGARGVVAVDGVRRRLDGQRAAQRAARRVAAAVVAWRRQWSRGGGLRWLGREIWIWLEIWIWPGRELTWFCCCRRLARAG